MDLGSWGMFFLKLIVLFAGVYVIIILTPKLATFIDSRRKTGDRPDEPRPERVQSENDTENLPADAESGENPAEESENNITESINQSENKQE